MLKLKALQAIKNVKLDKDIIQSAALWVQKNNTRIVLTRGFKLWRFAYLELQANKEAT